MGLDFCVHCQKNHEMFKYYLIIFKYFSAVVNIVV